MARQQTLTPQPGAAAWPPRRPPDSEKGTRTRTQALPAARPAGRHRPPPGQSRGCGSHPDPLRLGPRSTSPCSPEQPRGRRRPHSLAQVSEPDGAACPLLATVGPRHAHRRLRPRPLSSESLVPARHCLARRTSGLSPPQGAAGSLKPLRVFAPGGNPQGTVWLQHAQTREPALRHGAGTSDGAHTSAEPPAVTNPSISSRGRGSILSHFHRCKGKAAGATRCPDDKRSRLHEGSPARPAPRWPLRGGRLCTAGAPRTPALRAPRRTPWVSARDRKPRQMRCRPISDLIRPLTSSDLPPELLPCSQRFVHLTPRFLSEKHCEPSESKGGLLPPPPATAPRDSPASPATTVPDSVARGCVSWPLASGQRVP